MRPLLPLLPLALLAPLSLPALADSPTPSISLEGRGEVVSAPDTAVVNAGVATQALTARAALDANTKAMSSLLTTLKAAGIDAKDIQTSGFSVNPIYVYPDRAADGSTPPPQITGYGVDNGVTLKVRKLDSLGTILDEIVSAGGNTINGITFSVDDSSRLLDEARKAAFLDAQEKARIYADAAGVGLGPVQTIAEDAEQGTPRPIVFKAAMAAPRAAAPVPVEAGQLTFEATVNVVWSLKTGGE